MGAAAQHDLHRLGANPLDPLELLNVRADLEHGTGLHVPRQLRVGDLVVVRPPDGWPRRVVDAQEEVCVPEPPAVEEGRLEDDIGARCHGSDRLVRLAPDSLASFLGVVARDLDDRLARDGEVGKVASLVLEAPLANDVELAIVAVRSIDETGQGRTLQGSEMLAGQVADEIGGGEDRLPVDQLQ